MVVPRFNPGRNELRKDMIAIAVEKPNVLEIREDEKPAPGPGEVLVKVERAGICGSDVHILQGSNPITWST